MPAFSRGERQIDISILGGDFNSVNRGQTIYIGTTPNARNVGRIRAISASATQLTVAENDLNLRDGMYLTVVQYYEPWAVFPRIVLDDNNVPSFFKDFDITYTDQNLNLDPVVHMGPNHAVFLDGTPTGSYASIFWGSSGTFDPTDSSIPTGYAWNFEGGIPSASFLPDPGYIDYTGAGQFLTTLEVTSNRGKTFEGRRHVSVYTRPDQGPRPPILSWGMQSFEGSRDNGGYSLRLWLREDADFERIMAGSLVVLFTDDGEGPFVGKVGGNAENRSSILFNGYIEEGSIALNAVTNRLEFRVSSITGTMKTLASFSATLESVNTPATWNEMAAMNVDKAMAHYLRWHSTILTVADFQPSGDTMSVEFMDFERASLYEAVNNLYASALVANVIADRQGEIWAEIDANMRATGSARGLSTALTMTRQDWRGSFDIQERIDERLSYIELGGLAYSGPATGTTDPFLGGAPGDAPAYHGSLERVSGMVVRGQTHINELAGLAFARANARYPEVIVPIAGDYRILDIAPQERVLLSLDPADTYRQIDWTLKPFIPAQIRYQHQPADQVLLMETTLSEETEGPPGESVEIPVDPPFPIWIAPEINLPPINLPPPLDPIPIDPAPGTGDLVYVVTSNRVTRTRNFHADGLTTTFEDITSPLISGSIQAFRLDPVDPQNVAYLLSATAAVPSDLDSGPYLYRITSLDSASPIYTVIMTPREFGEAGPSTVNFDGALHGFDVSVSAISSNIIWVSGGGHRTAPPNDDVCKIVRTGNGGATWVDTSNDFLPRLSGNDSNRPIDASEHALQNAVAVISNSTPQEELFATLNQGSTWNEVNPAVAVRVKDFHVPFQGNGADLLIFYSEGEGVDKRLYRTEDRGTTRTDVSPNYDGNNWAKARQGPRGRASRQIRSYQANRLFMAAVLQRDEAEPTDNNDSAFFTSTDGGVTPASWFVRHVWTGNVGFLDWLKTDPNKLYALGASTAEVQIIGSADGGILWVEKTASWERDIGTIGAPDNLGFDRVGIFSVWTV
jgi:hypothetical protein